MRVKSAACEMKALSYLMQKSIVKQLCAPQYRHRFLSLKVNIEKNL